MVDSFAELITDKGKGRPGVSDGIVVREIDGHSMIMAVAQRNIQKLWELSIGAYLIC